MARASSQAAAVRVVFSEELRRLEPLALLDNMVYAWSSGGELRHYPCDDEGDRVLIRGHPQQTFVLTPLCDVDMLRRHMRRANESPVRLLAEKPRRIGRRRGSARRDCLGKFLFATARQWDRFLWGGERIVAGATATSASAPESLAAALHDGMPVDLPRGPWLCIGGGIYSLLPIRRVTRGAFHLAHGRRAYAVGAPITEVGHANDRMRREVVAHVANYVSLSGREVEKSFDGVEYALASSEFANAGQIVRGTLVFLRGVGRGSSYLLGYMIPGHKNGTLRRKLDPGESLVASPYGLRPKLPRRDQLHIFIRDGAGRYRRRDIDVVCPGRFRACDSQFDGVRLASALRDCAMLFTQKQNLAFNEFSARNRRRRRRGGRRHDYEDVPF